MLGWLEGRSIRLKEIHRFENVPVTKGEQLCWDFDRLLADIFHGLKLGIEKAAQLQRPVRSIGIDSWAVDFGLVDPEGQLLGPVVHYRDSRTDGMMETVFSRVPRERIFDITGIQFLPFNTIYQLMALRTHQPELLTRAARFMMIPDLVAWKLTGLMTCERTNATTTQLFDAHAGTWSDELIDALELPRSMFPDVIEAGSAIGALTPELVAEWDAPPDLQVVAVATHDTASAVVAVPATGSGPFAYLSCGTWSLMGTELEQPAISPEIYDANYTNEGGAYGTFRFLKNIMGLWILQECKRHWNEAGKPYTWDDLTEMASRPVSQLTVFDVEDPRFLPPGDMIARIRDWCIEKDMPLPETDAAVARAVLLSLTIRYRVVLEQLENLTGKSFNALHMVGGGIQNDLLCDWTARTLGRPVLAGPVEATALGNIGVQVVAAGEIKDVATLRESLRKAFPPVRYNP